MEQTLQEACIINPLQPTGQYTGPSTLHVIDLALSQPVFAIVVSNFVCILVTMYTMSDTVQNISQYKDELDKYDKHT